MELKIAVLAGDGIGPEISAVGVDVLTGPVTESAPRFPP